MMLVMLRVTTAGKVLSYVASVVALAVVGAAVLAVLGPGARTGDAAFVRLTAEPGAVVRTATVPLAPGGLARTSTATYSMVGVTWTEGDPTIRIRTRTDGAWRRWRALEPLEDLGNESQVKGSELLWVGRSDGVQVTTRGRASELELVLIDPGVLPTDARPGRPATAAAISARAGTTKPDHAPEPTWHTREQWGADDSWRNGRPFRLGTLKQAFLHHTATGNDYTKADVPALIRGMYRYHTKSLGWSDIGYNFLVDKFGRIWVGRAGGPRRPIRGAHTLGFNHTSVGISVIGNFERKQPSDWVLVKLARLMAWKLDHYGRDPAKKTSVRSHGSDKYRPGEWVRMRVVTGHRATNATACPGDRLWDKLPGLREHAQYRADRFS